MELEYEGKRLSRARGGGETNIDCRVGVKFESGWVVKTLVRLIQCHMETLQTSDRMTESIYIKV